MTAHSFRYQLVASIVVLLASISSATAADSNAKAKRPNVLIVLFDDMGYSDLGCYGSEIQTPNIDTLAQNGLRFTQFYNTARCWSSRAAILTGYYAQQVRRDTFPDQGGSGRIGNRPAWARLLPALLKPLGYRTYHSGKWHVDGVPTETGFDESFDYTDSDYHFIPKDAYKDEAPIGPVSAEGYFDADADADHAIRQLQRHAEKHADEPFFQYLCFTDPHFPVMAPKEDIDLYRNRYVAGWDALRQERYAKMVQLGLVKCELSPLDSTIIPSWNKKAQVLFDQIGPGEAPYAVPWNELSAEQKAFQPIKMAIHAAMIHHVDTQVGRVIAQLKAMHVMEDTLIFVLSDNGASAEQMIRGAKHDKTLPAGSPGTFLCLGPGWSSAANTPLRLHKSWVHEGGISTPLVVHWPHGILAHGELRHNPGHLVDLAPTIMELAGGQMPKEFENKPTPALPGRSLVPLFTKDGTVEHDYFWFLHINNRAIRVGDWKLVALNTSPEKWELYNLAADRSETRNMAAQYPDKVKELSDLWFGKMKEFRANAGLPEGKPKTKPSSKPAKVS